jgi:hypothetical protein
MSCTSSTFNISDNEIKKMGLNKVSFGAHSKDAVVKAVSPKQPARA